MLELLFLTQDQQWQDFKRKMKEQGNFQVNSLKDLLPKSATYSKVADRVP